MSGDLICEIFIEGVTKDSVICFEIFRRMPSKIITVNELPRSQILAMRVLIC